IDRLEAPDDRTVVATWKEPYIQADGIFGLNGGSFSHPLPKHLLEQPYREDRANLEQLPFWTTDFVSSGPFKLREWVPGQHALRDPAFRRAMLQGIDRQQLADELSHGTSQVAHSIIPPDDPAYPFVKDRIVPYAYDPQQAIKTITDLGFSRGADGIFHDAAGA